MARTRKEKVVSKLEDMKEYARKQLDQFADKLKGDTPGYTMSWAANMFTCAAEHDFAVEALVYFETATPEDDDDKIIEILREYTLRTVLTKSRNVSNKSTSVTSNYMVDCALEVRARFLDDIQFI